MKITAKGQLRHHFWGEYSAQITLVFDGEKDCSLALPLLKKATGEPGKFLDACGRIRKSPGWLQGKDGHEDACACFLAGDPLERTLDFLKKHGACEGIDSLAKSVDHGEQFEISLTVEDPRQIHLFS